MGDSLLTRVLFAFRWQCRAIVDPRHEKVISMRAPDRLTPDGTIEEGTEIAVFSVKICRRWRWHGGECR